MWIQEDVIERWYKETIKEAVVGDRIKVITDLYEDDGLEIGSIFQIEERKQNDLMIKVGKQTLFLHSTEFVVLEKTDMIRIGSKEYREVSEARNAGDLILVLRDSERKGYTKGQVLEVIKIEGDMFSAKSRETGSIFSIWFGEFIAITPITNEGSVERRVLDRFSETEKAILASPISTKDAFDLIIQYLSKLENSEDKNL